MKRTSPFATLCLTLLFMLFGSSAFSQGESAANIKSGSVEFATNSTRLSTAARRTLGVLHTQMQSNPSYRVVITGNAGGSKPLAQLSSDRVNAVVEYMAEQLHVDRRRFDLGSASSDVPPGEVRFSVAEGGAKR